MDRTFETGAAGSPPSPPASPSTGYPTAGSPSPPVPATKPGPWWYHMMTEELRAVIVAAGLTPDHTDVTQLAQAIQALFVANQKAVVINSATFEASVANGELVRWDSGNSRFDEAVADSTSNNRAVGVADVTNSKVYLYGECQLFSGLTPGARYYLDATTPGAITATAPTDAVMVGIAKSATVLWVDVDAQPATIVSATQGAFKNLQMSASGTAASVSVSFDELILGDGSGGYVTERNVAGTITTTNAGANGLDTGALATSTWYSVWRIGKTDGTRAFLFSTSTTAPTMPSGYTLKARIGWFRTDGTGNKYPLSFIQYGREVKYKVAAGSNLTSMPQMASGISGSLVTPTWTAVAVGAFVPTTAAAICLTICGTGDSGAGAAAAPNASYGASSVGTSAQTNPPPLEVSNSDTSASARCCVQGTLGLESSNVYYAGGRAGQSCMYANGWTDNI